MGADEYNRKQIENGDFTYPQITSLVKYWQRDHELVVDGYCGPNTQRSLAVEKCYPLPRLADGRKPIITNAFSPPGHKGDDFFYQWLNSDPDVPLGDGGNGIIKNGARWLWTPPGTHAVSAADGVMDIATNTTTGYQVWVNHKNNERTGYMHLESLLFSKGDEIRLGCPLGIVGDNPVANDVKHLHFEVSPIDDYAPMDPETWLTGAKYLQSSP